MGCCVSKNKRPPSSKPPHITSKSPPPSHPLLVEEEETVKEVLSETPSLPKHTSPRRSQHNRQNDSPFIKSAPLLHHYSKRENGAVSKKPYMAFAGNDDVSEETYSNLSESVSVSTTLTDKKENEHFHDIRKRGSPARSKNRSFSGEVKREKTVGRSPVRRSEPSPGRAGQGTGPVYSRRKDSGESSGRRSKSPVTRADSGSSKTNIGRSPSARKTGKSPSRVGSGLGDRIRRLDEGKESGVHKRPPKNSNESLENPLVSLECFIFL